MTDNWSLRRLMESLHQDIETKLSIVRGPIGHPTSKGDASELVWLDMLNTYLPNRYKALKAHVADSRDNFSQQIDVVICDRQYSPFIFSYQDEKVVPAESVYAVFETKQTIDASLIKYAMEKAASVRALHRTSMPIPHAGGTFDAKQPPPIIAGVLSFTSEWSPPLGDTLISNLQADDPNQRLDLGCVASHGIFAFDLQKNAYSVTPETKPATAFLFELIARLQLLGTVPMLDVRAYAEWLSPDQDAVTD